MDKQNKDEKFTRTSRAYILPAIAVIAIAALAFAGGFGMAAERQAAAEAGVVHFKNLVSVEVVHPDGSREPTQYSWNTVTYIGKNNTREKLSNLTHVPGNWTYIQLSTGTPAATDATCPSAVSSNGLDVAVGTTVVKVNTLNVGNYTVSKTFSVSGTQAGITAVCLLNESGASGPLMAGAAISSTNVADGDTLTVNYSVAVT